MHARVAVVPVLAVLAAPAPAGAHLRIDLDAVEPAPETFGDADLGHYRWVLDDEQQALYGNGGDAARRELMRVAWASLDPTPTTPENERKEEHFRRLAYARAEFPFAFPPWWDDRGELLIRYGVPESRTSFIGDERSPNRERWVYTRLQLAFDLEDPQLSDQFVLEQRPDRLAARLDQDAFEAPIDAGVPIRAWGFNDPFATDFTVPDFAAQQGARDFQRLLDRGAETIVRVPQVYVHDYGGEWLPVAFDAVSFASSEPGLTRLEVHTGIRARDLLYERRDGMWGAVLGVEAVAKTPDFREVARVRRFTHDRRAAVDDLEDRLVLDEVDVYLEPGSYVLALAVRDTTSRRVGMFQRPVEVAGFPAGELNVSGIQTAFRVDDAEPGAPFRKGSLQVAPWPLTKFPRGYDVHLYFEIYGLEQSPTGDTLFQVELLVEPREPAKKPRARTGVSTSWKGKGHGAIAREHFALDTSALGPGTFDLRLTVTDRIGDAVAERSTAITVSE